MKVKFIKIENFRQIKPNSTIEFGDKITLIAGKNATSKSSVLGMVCQPFEFKGSTPKVYTDNYDGVEKSNFKTIAGKLFQTDISEIFRLSSKFDDPTKIQYRYYIGIEDEKGLTQLPVYTQPRDGAKKPPRFVANDSHNKGEGNYPHPVIYLGLNRLVPLANCNKINIDDDFCLDADEKKLYSEWYKKISVLEDIKPEYIEADAKKYLGSRTELYNAETNSAGQGNLGVIFTALLSFKRLKKRLGNKYKGGILVIDEVDATLHVFAQEKLLEILSEQSQELALQIICTTHSHDMLYFAFHRFKDSVKVVSLYRRNGIEVDNRVDYDALCREMANVTSSKKEKNKTSLFFEDNDAFMLFKEITFGKLNDKYFCNMSGKKKDVSLSGDTLVKLSGRNLQELSNVVYIVDGDFSNQIQIKSSNRKQNILALPGENAIEKELYLMLYSLPESDDFWDNKIGGNSKELCFRDYSDPNGKDTKYFKDWLKEIKKNTSLAGRGGSKIYKLWIKKNKNAVVKFVDEFVRIFNKVSCDKISHDLHISITSKIKGYRV